MGPFDTIPESDWIAARESREAVTRPGKFQGCAPYVPFFWQVTLDGCADYCDATGAHSVEVTAADKVLFPELKRRKRVRLVERDDGFVVEV